MESKRFKVYRDGDKDLSFVSVQQVRDGFGNPLLFFTS